MASFNKHAESIGKQSTKNINQAKKHPSGFNKNKRKWIPEGKVFDGSVQEGQGFAFRRKQKAHHEYNKLLRKEEKRRNPMAKVQLKQDYPDHLKHLYLAEAEKLRKEEVLNELRRRKAKSAPPDEDRSVQDTATSHASPMSPSSPVHQDPAKPSSQPEVAELHRLNQSKKKTRKLTSYQKTKEEYERMQEKRAKKKEEALQNKKQREEAQRIYKQKKMQTYQILSKKTKKGQPNLNLQMDYLLQKIQNQSK
ncbi:hypothetical protein AAFF_G00082910 [Aldrovandia affinis]|uniref:Thyroid transcription factor 1-associated protein 26 n=1 Tax=Aldrovandia affinis TaxID=143900 RepID=A0AAD7RX22_9TELE|nr:hypothetical protein AAFF_G00082910 [Aldrovandia affinis]